MSAQIAFIGCGKMGEALLAGLLNGGLPVQSIVVVEHNGEQRSALEQRHPGLTTSASLVRTPEVVIAVKPDDVENVIRDIVNSDFSSDSVRALCIAGGISLATLHSWARPTGGEHTPMRFVRAMPNLPALLGAGVTAICAQEREGSSDDLDWAEELLTKCGKVVRVKERQMEAVTGISGSGPAYVYMFTEALVEGGVLAGLDRANATELAKLMVLGAARMMTETDQAPEDLRGAVTSPGGSTAAGLRALENRAFRAAVIDAVVSTATRSAEIGQRFQAH